MRDTLVLNASFEPLSTVTLNRAVVLVLQDKAVVVRTAGAAVGRLLSLLGAQRLFAPAPEVRN